MKRARAALLVVATWATWAATGTAVAHAQGTSDQEAARAHYQAGSAYYDQSDYADAVREFNEAYRLSRRPELLYNVAMSHERLEHWDVAIATLQRYLQEKPHAEDRRQIEAHIESLVKRRAEHATEAPPPAPTPPPPAPTPPPPSSPPPPPTTPPPTHVRHVASGIVGGLGLAALASAVGTGVAAQLLYDDLGQRCHNQVCSPSDRADVDRGRALTISTDVLIGVGAAAVIVGVVLFVVERRHPSPVVALGAPWSVRF